MYSLLPIKKMTTSRKDRMPVRLILVQVGRSPSKLPIRELEHRVREEASRAMWGNSCDDAGALERECFTCQRCGQSGTSSRGGVEFRADITIVLMDGDRFVGLLMGTHEQGALFVYNVCVEHSHRGKGFAAQLFAWLEVVYKGPLSLTVYSPRAGLFRGNRMVLKEVSRRFKALLTMYGRYGFEIVGVEQDMVRMRTAALRNTPPPRGRRVTP